MRIYEINTWTWLSELTERYDRPVTLATVPNAEWDAIAAFHFDAVWLMAAVAVATLPGASIWYANQFEGCWGRQPVQLEKSVTSA